MAEWVVGGRVVGLIEFKVTQPSWSWELVELGNNKLCFLANILFLIALINSETRLITMRSKPDYVEFVLF